MGRKVASIGHNFGDLVIEQSVLGPLGIEIVTIDELHANPAMWGDIDGVLLGTQIALDASKIDNMPNCKAIVRYGIGVDNVDLSHARERSVIVCNVTNYCREEVALHALSMALSLMRGLPIWDQRVRAGVWRGKPRLHTPRPSEVALGIVGLGQIGRTLATQAKNIFGSIIGFDPWISAEEVSRFVPHVRMIGTLEEFIGLADVISIHVPLSAETKNLFGFHNLHQMRPGCILINVSRGGIVDEQALSEGLANGQIGAAGLDTFVDEPIGAANPLIAAKNTLLSPHVAWMSDSAEKDLRRLAAEELGRVLAGMSPNSRVV